uniref:Uncharacterized protein C3orf26 homolog n=1 Tax=Phallusia mammillata TaxID=59560 RepID=A0A6F9D913_9ASCI|nr:uncharacterized protein C3orf26 homolog [Phallusia mammillata]
MADDLGDDWWEDKEGAKESDSDNSTEDLPSKGEDLEPVAEKRKLETVPAEAEVVLAKKKRRRRKRITDENIPEKGCDSTDLISTLQRHFTKLSSVEEEDLRLYDEHFCACNTDRDPSISSYLQKVLPKWRKVSADYKHKMSPLVIIVCGNALRACNLNTQAQDFKGKKCKSLKLFSKHMKIEDQIKSLRKGIVHFAVGTPARIKGLIQQAALSLEHTKAFIVDMNWQDVKRKSIVNIPEVRKSLMDLLRDHVIPACKTHKVQIGLF